MGKILDYLSLPEKNVGLHLPLFHDRATFDQIDYFEISDFLALIIINNSQGYV